jgi:hypothetical protein
VTSKAEFARIKNSLERERTRLKQEGLRLEKDRLHLTRERARVLAVLRLLCGRYGTNDWTDEADLDTVLAEHLARPLEHEMREVRAYVGGLQRRAERAEAELSTARATPIIVRAAPAPAPPPATASDDVGAADSRAVQRRLPPSPRPLRPTVVPDPVRRCLVVKSDLRGTHGYRSVCVCGWSSPHVSGEALAIMDGDRHCQNAELARREARA